MALLPFVPPHADEHLVSWAARSAQVQCGMTLGRVLCIATIRRSRLHLLYGLEEPARLVETFGGDTNTLGNIGIFRVGDGKVKLRNEVFLAELLRTRQSAYCPHCLLEDAEAPYGRMIWRFRPVLRCNRHQVRLVQGSAVDALDALVPDVAYPSPDRLLEAAQAANAAPVSLLQDYLEKRVSGETEGCWADTLRLDQVVKTAEALGLSECRDSDHHSDIQPDNVLEDARERGFQAVQGGEETIFPMLEGILRRAITQQRGDVPLGTLGPVYWRAKRDPDFGPFRPLLRRFILDTIAVAPGTDLLGEVVQARHRHSLKSLSAETGVAQATLKNLFSHFDEGRNSGHAEWTGISCDARKGEAAARAMMETIPVNAISAHIGCDATTVRAIVAAGLVEHLRDNLEVGVKNRTALMHRVTLASVNGLMNALAGTATRIAEKPHAGFTSFSAAARHLHWQVDRVIRLALSGKVEVFQHLDRTDFDGLLVDERQIHRVLQDSPLAAYLTKEQAGIELEVNVLTVENLMRIADQNGMPIIRRLTPLSGKYKYRHMVSKVDFERFQGCHVSIGRLAREAGSTVSEIARNLSAGGVEPIPCNATDENRVYRLSDL